MVGLQNTKKGVDFNIHSADLRLVLYVSPHDLSMSKRGCWQLYPEEDTALKGVRESTVDLFPVPIVREVSVKRGGWVSNIRNQFGFL